MQMLAACYADSDEARGTASRVGHIARNLITRVLLTAAFLVRCGNAAETSVAQSEQRVTPPKEESRNTTGPWIITSELDQRRFEPDQAAADLFAAIQQAPAGVATRNGLASHYGSMDYQTLSRFYTATARYAQSREVIEYQPEPEFRARCMPDNAAPAVVTPPLFPESLPDFKKGLGEALKELRGIEAAGDRNDCKFWLAWADTVRIASIHGLHTSALERERAVRILITLGDDAKMYPAHADSVPAVYLEIAIFFAAADDYYSAYCALKVARARVPAAAYLGDRQAEVVAAIERLEKPVEERLQRENKGH